MLCGVVSFRGLTWSSRDNLSKSLVSVTLYYFLLLLLFFYLSFPTWVGRVTKSLGDTQNDTESEITISVRLLLGRI